MRDVAVGVASATMSHPPIVLPIDRASRAPGVTPVVVLGTDAVLAALPATAVQLAQACRRAGFATAVPQSWGDELVAHACLEAVAARPGPAVCVACPLARARLRASGAPPSHVTIPLASPPAALARHLRRLAASTPLHVTYVGGCPGGADAAIDAQVAPGAFLDALAARGIVPAEQPAVFDDVLPPDRRRFLSLPGGVPSPDALAEAGGRRLVEVSGPDVAAQVAEHLLSDEPVLVDLAPGQGCVCSGATGVVPARTARLVAAALEPPRAMRSVVEPAGEGRATPADLACEATGPAAGAAARGEGRASGAGRSGGGTADAGTSGSGTSGSGTAGVGGSGGGAWGAGASGGAATDAGTARRAGAPPRFHDDAAEGDPQHRGAAGRRETMPTPGSTPAAGAPRATPPRAPSLTPSGTGGRRTPASVARHGGEGPPLARTDDGRLLPRAYVARRRSSPPTGLPTVPAPDAPASDEAAHGAPASTAAGAPAGGTPVAGDSRPAARAPDASTDAPAAPPAPRVTPPSSPVVGSIGLAAPGGGAAGEGGDEWRARLDEAIAAWRRQGFRTAVLERARALPHRPDVDGLLAAYAGAVERLRALEAVAAERRPELRGAPAFHDPERVGVAQTLVDALVGAARRG